MTRTRETAIVVIRLSNGTERAAYAQDASSAARARREIELRPEVASYLYMLDWLEVTWAAWPPPQPPLPQPPPPPLPRVENWRPLDSLYVTSIPVLPPEDYYDPVDPWRL